MNHLSWIIYLADVVNNLDVYLTIVGGICLVVTLFIVFGEFLVGDDNFGDLTKKYVLKLFLPIALVTLFVTVFIPSKQTMLMIAASQVGEKVYQDPNTQQVVTGLKETILAELAKIKKNAEK